MKINNTSKGDGCGTNRLKHTSDFYPIEREKSMQFT